MDTKDAKLIVASNLVIAALIRELMMSQRGGDPVVKTDKVIADLFNHYLSFLGKA